MGWIMKILEGKWDAFYSERSYIDREVFAKERRHPESPQRVRRQTVAVDISIAIKYHED